MSGTQIYATNVPYYMIYEERKVSRRSTEANVVLDVICEWFLPLMVIRTSDWKALALGKFQALSRSVKSSLMDSIAAFLSFPFTVSLLPSFELEIHTAATQNRIGNII